MGTKNIFLFLSLLFHIQAGHAQDFFINIDTVINHHWKIPEGSILKFGSKGHIRGTGTIDGGIIDADSRQWIFDTSLTVVPEGVYAKDFSARWFGAGNYTDNYYAIQKSIHTVLLSKTLKKLFIPAGEYAYGTSLKISTAREGKYKPVTMQLYGESTFWDCCLGTILKYTATDGFALGLQLNKGSEINNLTIFGQFRSPGGTDKEYFNIPFELYKDQEGKCNDLYTGFVVDYDGTLNNSGSTGIKVHDMHVGNFSIDYAVSPNGVTFNADILVFENIRCGDAKVGFATGQAQEKGNVIRGIYSWGNIHTLFSTGRYGKAQAGNYTIDGGNIAGRCIRLFDISQSGWYNTSIEHLYAESIGTIGQVYSQIPTSISNCTFHFKTQEQIGKQNLFYSNNSTTKFSNCIFRYYGKKDPMKFTGNASYENCFFSGAVIKADK